MDFPVSIVLTTAMIIAGHYGLLPFSPPVERQPVKWRIIGYTGGVASFFAPWAYWTLTRNPATLEVVAGLAANVIVAGLTTVACYLIDYVSALRNEHKSRTDP